MKKQLSTAMAAAMALGSVVPVLANAETVADYKVNERLANGLQLDTEKIEVSTSTTGTTTGTTETRTINKVYKRSDVYNYNGAEANERDEHTLKSQYADYKEIAMQKDEKDANNDLIVLAKKISGKNVTAEKNEADKIAAEIKYLEGKGYKKTTASTVKKAEIKKCAGATSGYEYISGEETIILELKKDNKVEDTKVIKKINLDNFESVEANNTTASTLKKDLLEKVVDSKAAGMVLDTTTNTLKVDFAAKEFDYKGINRLKYNYEKVADKVKVYKDEIRKDGKLIGYDVKISTKDGKTEILKAEFRGIDNFDSSKLVNLPKLDTTDFKESFAKDEILEAMLNGDIDASKDFRPKDSIKRSEFAKIVCTVFGLEVNKNTQVEPFTDVTDDKWYAEYVAALYNQKGVDKGTIINGYEDGTFRPDAPITRQEAAKIIASAYTIAKPGVMKQEEIKDGKAELTTVATAGVVEGTIKVNGITYDIDIVTTFKDDKEIANWADASVLNLTNKKVIKGYEDNTFRPGNTITREEAIAMLVRANN